MTEEQTTAEKRAEPLIDIQRPKQPQFDIEHQISRSLDDMRNTWDIAKDNWRRQSDFYQKHLEELYRPLRGQIAQSTQYEESALSSRIYNPQARTCRTTHRPACASLDCQRAARFFIAPTWCEHYSVPPYPNRYQDPGAYGGFGIESFLDPSIGRMGWYLETAGAGDISVASGLAPAVPGGSACESARRHSSRWCADRFVRAPVWKIVERPQDEAEIERCSG